MGMNCAEDPFKMGLFSITKHTCPGIFVLESPPRGKRGVAGNRFSERREGGVWVTVKVTQHAAY